ncbi:hypothetical protein DWX64_03970 [Clostridium sp. AF20-17LB]|nr:hypothetical protein [Clostridium sp. AF20-17LB]RHR06889.1 hypothetical protein DWX64_03970 [Clostridium sp. AF20-17LB]
MGFQRFYLIAGAFFCVKLVGEGYAVSFRLGAPGDAGMVPLRGSQIPGSRRSQAEAHRCGMVGRKEWGCDSGEGVYRWFMQCLKKAQKTLV